MLEKKNLDLSNARVENGNRVSLGTLVQGIEQIGIDDESYYVAGVPSNYTETVIHFGQCGG